MPKNNPSKSAVKGGKLQKGKKGDRVKKYFRETISEVKKISWPSKKELTNYTIAVIVIILIFVSLLSVIDFGLSRILELVS